MKCWLSVLLLILGCSCCGTSWVLGSSKENKKILSIGFFPNLTHAQALVAQALTRQGKGWFERYLPEDIKIEWRRLNAGPSAMENLVAGVIDVTYVGPGPALNLYNRTKGRDCRLLSGAVKGGSGLVLQKDFEVKNVNAWARKRIATPQYGNTQDIACRVWFKKQNIENIALLPTSNPDQLALFKKHQIDGAWTIEPWLSRLVSENEGYIYLSDDKNWTTILVGSAKFCEKWNALKTQLVQAHKDLSSWIRGHLEEAAALIQSEMKYQTALDFPLDGIKNMLKHIQIETEVEKESLQKWMDDARCIGFLKSGKVTPLDDFMQTSMQKEVMSDTTAKSNKELLH